MNNKLKRGLIGGGIGAGVGALGGGIRAAFGGDKNESKEDRNRRFRNSILGGAAAGGAVGGGVGAFTGGQTNTPKASTNTPKANTNTPKWDGDVSSKHKMPPEHSSGANKPKTSPIQRMKSNPAKAQSWMKSLPRSDASGPTSSITYKGNPTLAQRLKNKTKNPNAWMGKGPGDTQWLPQPGEADS